MRSFGYIQNLKNKVSNGVIPAKAGIQDTQHRILDPRLRGDDKLAQPKQFTIMSKVIVQLVTWNGAAYIPYLFASLKNQTSKDWELFILDNNSSDNTVAAIDEALKDFPVPTQFIKGEENLGFAKGHNVLYKKSTAPYVLLLNQDVYLTNDCIASLGLFLDAHDDVSAVSPRLMRWQFDIADSNLHKSFTNDIDAIGLKVFRNRRVIEQYTKQYWGSLSMQLPKELEVFGVSGAFPMYRRSTVDSVAYADGGIFDESYVAYKEDMDLAFRLQEAGTRAYVLTNVVAYHDRTGAGALELSDRAAIANKRKQSKYVSYHSYKNHLRTLYKHEYWQNLLLDLPWILWYEIKKFGYYFLLDRAILKGLKEVWQDRKNLNEKRSLIKAKRALSWKAMRRWWTV